MKLYHGTSAKNIDSILKDGILVPSATGESNWDHTVKANPNCVYLTNIYAGYFAAQAAKDDEKWAIIEIDTDLLCERYFRPDEDAIAHSLMATRDKSPELLPGTWGLMVLGRNLNQITEIVRDKIDDFADLWEESIKCMGTCCYKHKIPAKAIARIAVYDPDSNRDMTIAAQDPSITPMNYYFCKAKYEAITKWLMGEKITAKEFLGFEIDNMSEAMIDLNAIEESLANQQIELIDPKVKA